MTSAPRRLELTTELALWHVTLLDGHVLQVAAHGYGQEDVSYVVAALLRGSPNYEIDLLVVPRSAVRSILTA